MQKFRRYAVYYAPLQGSALETFGANWLGWDANAGLPRSLNGHPAPQAVETPRKYGFHGTLKPPFRLVDWRSPAQLEVAIAELATRLAPFDLPMKLGKIGQFLAIIPEGTPKALSNLAAACVTELDSFRAPPSEAELAKRRAPGLTPVQEALLTRWGYPYVLSEFKFHLTLSSKLNEADQAALFAHLDAKLAPILSAPVPVRELVLFGEAEDGQFHILTRFPLSGPALSETP